MPTPRKNLRPLNPRFIVFFTIATVLPFFLATGGVRIHADEPIKDFRMEVKHLHGDLYEIEWPLAVGTVSETTGNVTVYVTSEGLILVDGGEFNVDETAAFMAKVRSISNLPVKYVFITHYHQDHIGAIAAYLKMGAQVISTANTRSYLMGKEWKAVQLYDDTGKFVREQPYYVTPGIPVTPPPVVFTDEMDIFLGGKEVRARYLGPAHTDGDAFIFFPAERAVHMGDVLKPYNGPFIDYHAGGSVVEAIKTLNGLLKLRGGRPMKDLDDFDIAIAGHGPVRDRAGVLAQRDALVKMRDRVIGLKRAGKTYAQITLVMADEYNWKPGDRNLSQWTLPGMMKELN